MSDSILSQNIVALRKHLGMKQGAFAEAVHSDQPNVSKWETKGITPGSEPLARMAELAGCSVHQFFTTPWTPHHPAPTRAAKILATDEVIVIERLDLSLSMGPGTLIDDYVEAEPVRFDPSFVRLITRAPYHRLKLVTGIGDSMYPTLNWGDTIMIDTTDRALAKQDAIYWISVYGASGLKRLRAIGKGRVLVVSDNPSVPDQEVDAEDLRIEGRAVWFARGL